MGLRLPKPYLLFGRSVSPKTDTARFSLHINSVSHRELEAFVNNSLYSRLLSFHYLTMSSNPPSKPAKAGLSLYASLLDPSNTTSAPGTISRSPVVFSKPAGHDGLQDEAAAQKQQLSAGSYIP